MSFEQLWLKLVGKKPLLADPKSTVEISTAQFQDLLRSFYNKGFEAGKAAPSIFDQMFGGMR